MFRWICLCILISIVQSITDQDLISNFNLQPDFVILNSTSKRTFLCTKQNDTDEEDFEITTYPNVPFEQIKIYEKRLNNTAMEITIEVYEYIGFFKLVCSSFDNRSIGIEADILVGAHPDAMSQIGNCLVFENRYIDCIVRAPIIAMAIENKYPCHFDLNELQSNVYKQPPDIIQTNLENQTITFRWFPLNEHVFPMNIQVLLIGVMKFFGSTQVIIDLTPHFYIPSNFMLKALATSDIQIEFHQNHLGDLICRGNASINDQSQQIIHRFKKSNPINIRLTNLLANTWYRICCQCYRADNVTTVSQAICQTIRTDRSFYWLIYLFIPIGIVFTMIFGIFICTIMNWSSYIKQRLCTSRTNENRLDTEATHPFETIIPDQIETTIDLQKILNGITDNEENPLNESIPLTNLNTE